MINNSMLRRPVVRAQRTDRGIQRLLVDQGITCSVSRPGRCWNYAAMESFFSTLKIGRVFGSGYKTPDEARAEILDHIARFYNPRRRHSTLNGLSPVEFEKCYARLTACP